MHYKFRSRSRDTSKLKWFKLFKVDWWLDQLRILVAVEAATALPRLVLQAAVVLQGVLQVVDAILIMKSETKLTNMW